MTQYVVKLVFDDGEYYYPSIAGNGNYHLYKDMTETMFFDSYQEAEEYYRAHLRDLVRDDGVQVDPMRCTIVSVNANW